MERRTEFIARQALARIDAKRDASRLRRCAGCGAEYRHVHEPCCPRCGAEVPPDHVTSDDATPYAEAERRDRRAARNMRRWVYAAGAERIRYLSLIRRSAASRRFAHRHLLMTAGALTFLQLTHVGWHRVVRTTDNAPHLATAPTGRGWVKIAGDAPGAAAYGPAAVWYNPILSGAAAAAGGAGGVLLVHASLFVLKLGAGSWLGSPHREQGRLRGAIDYGTAWLMPVVYAGALLPLLPMRDVIEIATSVPVPSRAFLAGMSAVAAGCGLLLWWFYGVRISMTVPPAVRTRAAVYYAIVAPLLIGLLVAAWFIGLGRLFDMVSLLFKLKWLIP